MAGVSGRGVKSNEEMAVPRKMPKHVFISEPQIRRVGAMKRPLGRSIRELENRRKRRRFNQAAAFAYILSWVSGIIVYLTADRNDTYTKFHALQSVMFGIIFSVVWFILWAVVSPLSSLNISYVYTDLLALIMWTLIGAVLTITGGLFLLITVAMMFAAFFGRRTRLPGVGRWAEAALGMNRPVYRKDRMKLKPVRRYR